jgi:NADH-quinone oxidoreductase subunit M
MFTAFDNFPALLIWLPLIGGLLSFLLKKEGIARIVSMASSLLTLVVVLASIIYTKPEHALLNQVSYVWLHGLGSSFSFLLDELTKTLCLLTAVVFPIVILIVKKKHYKNEHIFFGLLMLTQCGLMGVFMAADALVFYFFWELALIPVYFLSSIWGGEKRIKATFKFFIYTFIGSLLLLIGILYMYLHTEDNSFSIVSFYRVQLTLQQQFGLFFLFFFAFAIKMPIVPFHTWQPDAFVQAPTPVTKVLSGVMVKMGVFGVIRWLLPLFPLAVKEFNGPIILIISIGMVYASLIAIKQDSIKRLIAYSSIAHIGLMAAGVFALKEVAMQGVVLQMFNHGINIVALWVVADIIEKQTGVNKISELGGIATKAPVLSVFFVIAAMANIALPLTNAFVGEFMIFNGLFKYNPWIAALAGISIILSAVYTLNMIKNVLYGSTSSLTEKFIDVNYTHVIVFAVLVSFIITIGIYPEPILHIIEKASKIPLYPYK